MVLLLRMHDYLELVSRLEYCLDSKPTVHRYPVKRIPVGSN